MGHLSSYFESGICNIVYNVRINKYGSIRDYEGISTNVWLPPHYSIDEVNNSCSMLEGGYRLCSNIKCPDGDHVCVRQFLLFR